MFTSLYILIMNTQLSAGTQNMFSIFYSGDREELEQALSYFSCHKLVRDFNLLSKKKNVATAFYQVIPTSMFKKMIPQGFRIHPVVVHQGIEKWFFITNSMDSLTAEQIDDKYTKVKSLKHINQREFLKVYPHIFTELHCTEVLNEMSKKDLDILKIAVSEGYFQWPRYTNLTDLSKQLKMSKSTLSYHFRTIERKLAGAFSDSLETHMKI